MSQPDNVMPTPEEASSALEKNVTGDLPKPQGVAGQYGRAVGEFLPYAAFGPPTLGGIGERAAQTIIPALTSETAGLASEGTPYEGAARTIGALAGAGLSGMRPRASGPLAPTIQDLKDAAKAGYEHPDVAGVRINSTAAPRLSQEIQGNLNSTGIDENLAPKTFSILDKMNSVPEDSFLTVDNLRSLRRTLGTAAKSIDPTERLAARSAMQHVDEFLSNLSGPDLIAGNPQAASSILKDANANYAAAMRATQIDKQLIRSELRAAAANSGQNVANTIRQRMADVLINPKLQGGFSPDELGQMERIVRGSPVENATRYAGNVLGGGGGMLSAMWGLGGLATHGIMSMAPIAGYTLRKIANSLAMRNVGRLNEAVRMRSPLGAQISAANPAASSIPGIGSATAIEHSVAQPGRGFLIPQGTIPAAADQEQQQ